VAAPPVPETPPAPRTARGERRPADPVDALRAEVALLGRARTAFDRGDLKSALRALRAHERRFGRGQLTEERAALEVIVRARAGETEHARELGRRFLTQHARSVHVASVRDALASLPQ
jgi:outer membrane protein assembly factor BamD (BamD/ComL family)